MICTKCGARLLDTDQFCSKCGARVIKEKRCPDCGAVLREGTKFCHECGRAVESAEGSRPVSEETIDIPFEAIERSIVSETEARVMAERAGQNAAYRKPASGKQESAARRSPKPPEKKRNVPEPPPKKRKPVYREEDWEEEDWEDDDWEDEEEESVDVITIMTAVAGCVLLVVLAVLGYRLYQQYVPKNYDRVQEEQTEEEEQSGGQDTAEDDGSAVYTLTIVDNVNVRDNPSTSGTNILKVAKAGETYECYGTAGDGSWYEIRLEDGTTGYVYQDYVTVE